MKYILYARKSTESEDRQLQSIGDQLDELNEYAVKNKLNIVKTFTESKSAKKKGRPKFNEMLKMIEDGKANAILCWKLNRLTRNPRDSGELQGLLQEGVIKVIETPFKRYLPDDNALIMNVEAGVANQFILDLRRDVKRGMKKKLKKGWMPTYAPLGYINDKYGEKGEKKIFTDPERFNHVKKMWDLLLKGNHTVSKIRQMANEEWGFTTKRGKPISNSSMYSIFTNQFYCGYYYFAAELYEGKHEKMITPDQFDLAQTILGERGKPRPKSKTLPFTGILRCGECGRMITTESKRKIIKSTGEIKTYTYHKCTQRKSTGQCSQKPTKYEDLIKQIHTMLDSITIPDDFLKWLLPELERRNKLNDQNISLALTNLHKQHEKCIASMGNLITMFTSIDNADHSLLTADEYKDQKNILMNRKKELESNIAKKQNSVDQWINISEETFKFAIYAKCWFDKADYEKKAEILSRFGQSFTLKDGYLSINLKPQYFAIKENLLRNRKTLENIRTKKTATASDLRAKLNIWSG